MTSFKNEPSTFNKDLFPGLNSPFTENSSTNRLAVLWYHRTLFIITGCIILAGILIALLFIPRQFEAYSMLLIDPQAQTATSSTVKTAAATTPIFNRTLANQALIISQSMVIATRTIERCREIVDKGDSAKTVTVFLSKGNTLTSPDAALKLQKHYISVKPAGTDVDVIQITAHSTNPFEAARLANIYTEEYVRFTGESSRQRISASRAFLETQVNAAHTSLQSLEEEIKQYRTTEEAISLDEASKNSISQIAQLEATLDGATIEKSMHEATRTSLEDELKRLQPILTSRVASGAETEIHQLQAKIADLELLVEQITFRNPNLKDIPSADKQVADLKAQISRYKERVFTLSEQYVNDVLALGGVDPTVGNQGMTQVASLSRQAITERIAISECQARIDAIRKRLSEYNKKLSAIPKQAMYLAQLERNRLSTERLYTTLSDKLQDARIAEIAETGFAQILRPAMIPVKPVQPKPFQVLVLGFFAACIAGVAIVLIKQKRTKTLYTPSDIEANGFITTAALSDAMYQKACFLPSPSVNGVFQKIFLSLGDARTILVSGITAESSAPPFAVNLAYAAASLNKKVLIVDADFHAPSLCKEIGTTPSYPLDTCIESQSDPQKTYTPVPKTTSLFIAGTVSPNNDATKITASKVFADMLETFRTSFDCVIISSAPLGQCADAIILAALADTTVVVAHAGKTSGPQLRQSVNEISLPQKNQVIILNHYRSLPLSNKPSIINAAQSRKAHQS
jgi:uncharacterized protein involved in exopolysaccharide biosynthesis/Mrp family chromosome partitioning ATPase